MANNDDDEEYLPPDDGNGEFPFDENDDRIEDVYGNQFTAESAYDSFQDSWKPNEGGFDTDTMFGMIYEIDNVWWDEEGYMHFDYEWESPDGEYSGHGSI